MQDIISQDTRRAVFGAMLLTLERAVVAYRAARDVLPLGGGVVLPVVDATGGRWFGTLVLTMDEDFRWLVNYAGEHGQTWGEKDDHSATVALLAMLKNPAVIESAAAMGGLL